MVSSRHPWNSIRLPSDRPACGSARLSSAFLMCLMRRGPVYGLAMPIEANWYVHVAHEAADPMRPDHEPTHDGSLK